MIEHQRFEKEFLNENIIYCVDFNKNKKFKFI